jgi:hypothetical protein
MHVKNVRCLGGGGGRGRCRPFLAINALLALQLGACAGLGGQHDHTTGGGREREEREGLGECEFVEQLVDVHCRNLQLMRLQCARHTDLSEAEHKLNCCRQACCAQELCQIYVTNIHRARDDVENIVSCWMGNHTFVDCGSSAGGETTLALGWVGERAKTSSVYADDYLSHLLLTITGLQTDTQSAHPGTIHMFCIFGYKY